RTPNPAIHSVAASWRAPRRATNSLAGFPGMTFWCESASNVGAARRWIPRSDRAHPNATPGVAGDKIVGTADRTDKMVTTLQFAVTASHVLARCSCRIPARGSRAVVSSSGGSLCRRWARSLGKATGDEPERQRQLAQAHGCEEGKDDLAPE